MIEILIILSVTRNLGAGLRGKNRSAAWSALFPVLWFLGEIVGASVAVMNGAEGFDAYGPALVGAFAGGLLAWVIIRALPPIPDDNGLPKARVL